jgi:hypothetical protein
MLQAGRSRVRIPMSSNVVFSVSSDPSIRIDALWFTQPLTEIVPENISVESSSA